MSDRGGGRAVSHLRSSAARLMALVAGGVAAACLPRPADPPRKVPPVPGAQAADVQRLPALGSVWFEPGPSEGGRDGRFLARAPGYTVSLAPDSMELRAAGGGQRRRTGARWRMELMGANRSAPAEGVDPLPGNSHYLLGNDRARWRTGVPHFGGVRYRDVYPDIDLLYYRRGGELQYDFVLQPGTDPARIRLAFTAEDKEGGAPLGARIDPGGDLVLTSLGVELRQRRPVVYQEIDGSRREVAGRFVVQGTDGAAPRGGVQVGFQVAVYDRQRPLVIDPVVLYSTYLGGSSGEFVADIAVDQAGSAYVLGATASADFPGRGPVDGSAFVAKLSPGGDAFVYLTYLDGGAGRIDIDDKGNAYVSGTAGPDFPTTPGTFQPNLAGEYDVFVTKLDPSGSALVFDTYLGGSGRDSATGIAVDEAGNVFVTGWTDSPDFPTLNSVQPVFSGGPRDAFLAKFDASGTRLHYATYLGGADVSGANSASCPSFPICGTEGAGVALGPDGSAYVTGTTWAADFPTTPGALQGALAGAADAFIARVSAVGDTLSYSTFLGGSDNDRAAAIAVDGGGRAHVVGGTRSSDFPTANPAQAARAGGWDGFVTKVDAADNRLIYSTYLGGRGGGSPLIPEEALAIALDPAGNAYVAGTSVSDDFPVRDPFDATTEGKDAFVASFDPSGSLRFSTLFGGGAGEVATALAVDGEGDIYIAGTTDPTWPFDPDPIPLVNPLQPLRGGYIDAFVAKLTARTRADLCAYVALDPVPYPYRSDKAGAVAIIEAARQAVLGQVRVAVPGDLLRNIAIGPDGRTAYAANASIGFPNSGAAAGRSFLYLAAVDTATHRVARRIELEVPTGPGLVAVSPDGSRLFVETPEELFVLDAATDVVLDRIPGDWRGSDLVMAPDGRRLYHFSSGRGVQVIDTATMEVTATIALPPRSRASGGAAISPDGAWLYVAVRDLHAVGVVDTATNTLASVVPVPLAPEGVAVAPDGGTVYLGGSVIANLYGVFGGVAILDAQPPRLRSTVPLDRRVVDVAVTPDGKFVYATNAEANTVTVLETVTHQLTAIIPVPGAAGRIALATMPNGCTTPPECGGDCSGDATVSVDEVVRVVQIVLGQMPLRSCFTADANGDGRLDVSDAVQAVRSALEGCPQA